MASSSDVMLLVTGSSCSGKSTASRLCAGLEHLVVHDCDESGVPSSADSSWRQEDLERWVRRALSYQLTGQDLLLTGQSPLGELLAAPSSPRLEGLAVCLLDVADRDRWIRLERRDPGKWSDERKRAFIGWARWHRAHATDPQDRPQVIRDQGWNGMDWDRWSSWSAGDNRWQTKVIDTTQRSLEQTGNDLRQWILGQRRLLQERRLPLRQGWHVTRPESGPR